MTSARTPHHSLLDDAYGKRLAGDRDGALHIAIAVLESDYRFIDAAALLARILVDEGRSFAAGETASRLCDAYVRRGDLASATSMLDLAGRAGEERTALRRAIAEAFGKGSALLADVSMAPPPIPRDVSPAAALRNLRGAPLFDKAEQVLTAFLSSEDPIAKNTKVPALPLFSALRPPALEQLIDAFEVKEVKAGERILAQGEEGREAFVLVRGALEVVRSGDAESKVLALLGPGSIFGEMALASASPRAASVIATEPSVLLAATRDELEAVAEDEPAIGLELGEFCRARMLSNLLRHSRVLRSVDAASRDELVRRFHVRSFAAGEVLVHQGQEGEGMLLIASGEVEVGRVEKDGEHLVLARLGAGDVVGEISLVLKRPAVANVVAIHPTIALELTPAEFRSAIHQHTNLLKELYEMAIAREEETRSVVAQEAVEVDDAVLV